VNSLREWWALPVDYGWNVAFARSQQALDAFVGTYAGRVLELADGMRG